MPLAERVTKTALQWQSANARSSAASISASVSVGMSTAWARLGGVGLDDVGRAVAGERARLGVHDQCRVFALCGRAGGLDHQLAVMTPLP